MTQATKLKESIIRNIQRCKTPETIQKIRDWIWDHADGDRHLLNLATARESCLFGTLTYKQWHILLNRTLNGREWMLENVYSDHALFITGDATGSETHLLNQLNELYNESNGR